MKMLTIVNSSGYVERIVHAVLNDGHYRHHLRRLSARVRDAQTKAVSILQKLSLRPQIEDTQGYYMWVGLPDGLDDIEVTRRASRESIFLAPGSVFEVDGARLSQKHLRLNIAYVSDPRFHEFVRRELA
jgi:DNA-binding transcriptional MocR family regulator